VFGSSKLAVSFFWLSGDTLNSFRMVGMVNHVVNSGPHVDMVNSFLGSDDAAVPHLHYEQHFVTGRNVLITGCTSGIGEALVHLVADLKPNKIFLACQSQSKGEALQEQLKCKNVQSHILLGDMGNMAGAQRIADAMLATKEPLHILVWNAILWEALQNRNFKVSVNREEHQEPGFYSHFATNYLSMVILCKTLKPLLEQNTPSRIVITGCSTHMDVAEGEARLDEQIFAPLHLQDLNTASLPAKDKAYAQTKLLQYMWVKKFAETVAPKVSVMVYNPGQCKTNHDVTMAGYDEFMKKIVGGYGESLMKRMMGGSAESLYNSFMGIRKPEDGAMVALWCADSPDGASANGKYIDFGIVGPLKMNPPCELGFSPSHNKSSISIMDPTQVDRLWNLTEEFLAWQNQYQQQKNSFDIVRRDQQQPQKQYHSSTHHQKQITSVSKPLPNLLTSKPPPCEKKSCLVEL